MSEIQSIIFDKKLWSISEAKKWLKDRKFKFTKVDKKQNFIRFRQQSPKKFNRFRTLIRDLGIRFILGFK